MGNVVDKITTNVWLGCHQAVREQPFDVIISAMTERDLDIYQIRKKIPKTTQWFHIPIDDDPKEPIQDHFLTVHKIIRDAEQKGQIVLVHCAAGISRSAALVTAHCMMKFGLTAKEALAFVQNQRSIAHPNEGFLKALEEFQKVLPQRYTHDRTEIGDPAIFPGKDPL